MSILDRLKKHTTIKNAATLSESELFSERDVTPTSVPMLNVALSGSLNGGLTPGVTMIAGPSKHFKTSFALIMASAYLDKYKDSALLFYDSEFGTPQSYFEQYSIDTSRVLHTPITDIEELKHDIMTQLQEVKRGDHLIVIIDSIGNLASRKEVEDALDGKTVADMTRAKQMKSLFRMITPHLTLKNISLIVVNHTYKELALFPRDIVGGGTGSYYSSDNIWIVGRQQEKESGEVAGYNFIINVEKSRFVKEKSKIPITVMFDGGINKYSGLFELCLDAGIIKESKKGWYTYGELTAARRAAFVSNTEFWESLLKDDKFNEFINRKYKLVT